MRIADFLTTPCVVRYPGVDIGETDDMGDPIGARPVEIETVCDLQQSSATEMRDGGLVDVTAWRCYLPPDVEVGASTTIDVDGLTYAAEGSGWVVKDPFEGTDSHVEAVVRLVQ